MAKQENLSFDGQVIEELGNSMFRVELDIAGSPEILCTISGKIRKNYIKIITGDLVTVEVSPYDLTRGRITVRRKLGYNKNQDNNELINNSINNKKSKKKC